MRLKLTFLVFLLFFFAQIKRIKMQEYNLFNTNENVNNVNDNHFDVLILGGGLSGLGAGLTLKKTDKSFVILEAQERNGGRIKTTPLNKYDRPYEKSSIMIEEGAQWLHSKDNYLYELASRKNLLIDYESEEGLGEYVRDDGYVYDNDFVKRIEDVVTKILEECETFAQSNVTDYPSSVDKYLRDEFDIFLNNETLTFNDKELAKQLLDWHIRYQIIDNSCYTLKELSAKSWGKYSFNGETEQLHINFKYGYKDLIDVIVDEIGEKNILNNKEIIHIDWHGKSLLTNLPIIRVRTADGQIFSGNHVIITFSIGVLKTKLNEFTPRLPYLYRQTIEDLGIAAIGKIFLQFDEPWWGELMGVQMLWNNTDYDDHWTRWVTGFDVVKPKPDNTLLGWVGGYGLLQMEKLTDHEIINDCIDLLSRFTRLRVPLPANYFISRWKGDRFAKGAYSFTTTENDKHGTYNYFLLQPVTLRHLKDTTKFKRNIPNLNVYIESNNDILSTFDNLLPENDNYPILLFAGEACHEDFFATAHGAFLSGIDQANKIIQFYTPN